MAKTHKVKVGIGNFLALQDSPSEVHVTDVSQVSDVQHFWESEDFKSYLDGTEFELLEQGLGHQCEWDHVKIADTDITGYFYNKYIEPLSDTKTLNYGCDSGELIVAIPHAQDWTKK